MINIFIPTVWKNSFIIQKKILCIAISGYAISLSLLRLTGKKKIVEISKKEIIKKDESISYEQSISSHLEKMLEGIKYDYVKLIIPSSSVLFKFLTVPFLDLEHIKMIIPFEIEQSLPFGLQDISIDCVQLKKDIIKKESQVLVAVTKQDTILQYKEIIKNSGLPCDIVSVDIIEYLSIFLELKIKEKQDILIILNQDYATFGYVEQGLLKSIKIDKEIIDTFIDLEEQKEDIEEERNNLFNIIEEYNSKQDSPSEKINFGFYMQKIISGLQKINKNNEEINNYYVILNGELKNNSYDILKKYILAEKIISINQKLIPLIEYKNKFDSIEQIDITVIGGSLFSLTESFNLFNDEYEEKKKYLLKKQLIAFLILFSSLIFGVIILNYIKINKFSFHVQELKKESIEFIKKNFDVNIRSNQEFEKSYKEAESHIKSLEYMWIMFEESNRYSSIKYLENISKYISKNLTNLIIDEISIKLNGLEGQIIFLKGRVDNFSNLHLFEQNLRDSKLFLTIPQSEDLQFNYVLKIKK